MTTKKKIVAKPKAAPQTAPKKLPPPKKLSFKEELLNAMGGPRKADPLQCEVLSILDDATQVLEAVIDNPRIDVIREPKSITKIGVQHDITAMISETAHTTILRIYVETTGYPVHLHISGTDVRTCNNAAELKNAIIKFYCSDLMKERIRRYGLLS